MSINSVQLVGRIGQDIELKQFNSGDSYANFSLATSERWTDKTGEKQERTEWHRCTITGRGAEVVSEYVKKGDWLAITGSIRYRQYTDNDGIERTETEIRVDRFTLLGGKSDNSGRQQAQPQRQTQRQQSSAPQRQVQQPQRVQQPAARRPQPQPKADFDDDIPF